MMNRRTHEPNALSRLVLSLLLVLQVAAAGSAQTPSSPAKPAEPNRDSAGGRHEGIKVHGHWVIDVRNPDGSLAQHRDFENALGSWGAADLAAILARTHTPGTWHIQMGGGAPPTGPCGTAAFPRYCSIFEPQATRVNRLDGTVASVISGLRDFETANLVVSADGPFLDRIRLAGTATASLDGFIGQVNTFLGVCPPTVSATMCTEMFGDIKGGGAMGFFSAAEASTGQFTPLPVKPGQIIQVTVTISFS